MTCDFSVTDLSLGDNSLNSDYILQPWSQFRWWISLKIFKFQKNSHFLDPQYKGEDIYAPGYPPFNDETTTTVPKMIISTPSSDYLPPNDNTTVLTWVLKIWFFL